MSEIIWDAFISHASEDKDDVVFPLVQLLQASGLKIWLDKSEILLGDSLRVKIDEGLSNCQFGIIIFSHSFFAKNWTKAELDALFLRDIAGESSILPVWHGISIDDVKSYSPLLAGRLAVNTGEGLDKVKEAILTKIFKVGRKSSIGKPIYSGKLSKEAMMEFPEGSFLVSNCYSSFDRKPLVEDTVSSLIDRESFWKYVKSCGANGRLCHVFKKYEDYKLYKKSLPVGL